MKLNTAIIGCGKVAHLHAKALQEIAESHFVAVQHYRAEKAEAFAAAYGVQAYTDVAGMIAREKVDVAIVCTPHPQHREPALQALQAGAHVLVEKPLASTLEDCDAMIETAARLGKTLGVVSQRRFYPAVQRVKTAIDQGKIGRPVLGTVLMLGWRDQRYYESDPWRGSWAGEGGGVLVNQAPHQLDLLQWLMQDEIAELYGVWKNLNHPYIEVDDTALAILKFRRGGVANIVVSNAQKPGIYAKVHVHGSNGASVGVQTDGGAMFIAGIPSVVEPPKNDIWTVPGEDHVLPLWEKQDADFFQTTDPVQHYITQQNQDFIDAVLQGRAPEISGLEGRKTVEIFTAVYRSMQENGIVKWPFT